MTVRSHRRVPKRRRLTSATGGDVIAAVSCDLDAAEAELPVILGPDGVNEPVAAYMYYRRHREGDDDETLEQYAYVLREFFFWVRSKGIHWQNVLDLHISEWLKPQASLSPDRLGFKHQVVFDFYFLLQKTGYLAKHAGLTTDIVGIGPEFPIQAEAVQKQVWVNGTATRETRTVLVPFRAPRHSTVERRSRPRRVPSDEEVPRLFHRILESRDDYGSVCRWFHAAFMASVGLRASGVAFLGLAALEAALRLEGIAVPAPVTFDERAVAVAGGWNPRMPPLEGLAYWPEGQQRLIDALLALAERREFIYVVVVEKGRKARKVQVPIALFRETLRRWVWDHRARFIDSVKRRDRAWLPPDALWLSRKTRRGLVAHSIGNEMKKAFARLGPPSDALSGHRLRAFYLTQLIRRLYRKALALQGRLLDVDAILNEAAELAGHSDPKSLKPYLDQEIMAGLALDGHAVMVVQKEDAEILRGIAGALDDGVHGLHARLRELANEFELKPIPDVETARDAVAALVRHQERVSHRADRG